MEPFVILVLVVAFIALLLRPVQPMQPPVVIYTHSDEIQPRGLDGVTLLIIAILVIVLLQRAF